MFSDLIDTKAILVHRHQTTGVIDVTTHNVIRNKGQFKLAAGQLMAESEQRQLGRVLLEKKNDEGYIHPQLIYTATEKLVFYIPAQRTEVVYRLDGHNKEEDRFLTALPTMVVKKDGREISVVAVSGKSRPDMDAPIYYPPLGNVYQDATVCQGSFTAKKVGGIASLIESLTGFVIESTNTHAGNIIPIKGISDNENNSFAGQIDFMKEVGESGKAFPLKKLKRVNAYSNLKEFIDD